MQTVTLYSPSLLPANQPAMAVLLSLTQHKSKAKADIHTAIWSSCGCNAHDIYIIVPYFFSSTLHPHLIRRTYVKLGKTDEKIGEHSLPIWLGVLSWSTEARIPATHTVASMNISRAIFSLWLWELMLIDLVEKVFSVSADTPADDHRWGPSSSIWKHNHTPVAIL